MKQKRERKRNRGVKGVSVFVKQQDMQFALDDLKVRAHVWAGEQAYVSMIADALAIRPGLSQSDFKPWEQLPAAARERFIAPYRAAISCVIASLASRGLLQAPKTWAWTATHVPLNENSAYRLAR